MMYKRINKNKIILNYLNFKEGKLLTENDRKAFPKRFEKLKNFLEAGEINIKEHPAHLKVIRDYLISMRSEAEKKAAPRLMEDYKDMMLASVHAQYYQCYKKHVSNNDIYVISENILDYFSQIELPENLQFKDIAFFRDLPAIFLFENGVVGYLDHYIKQVEESIIEGSTELIILLFNHNKRFPFASIDFFINSSNEEMNNRYLSDFFESFDLKDIESLSEIVPLKKMAKFLYNLLLFLGNKDDVTFQKAIFNEKSEIAKKNFESNKTKRNLQKWQEIPAYDFIDLEVTMNNYSMKYYNQYEKEEGQEGTPKRPHWRSGHWHRYWKGKRGEAQEQVLRFIPATWVGPPELQKQQTVLRVFKVKKPNLKSIKKENSR